MLRDFNVSAAVQEDYDEQVWQFPCVDCGRGFPSKAGLAIHKGRHCKQQTKEDCELERIVDVRGHPDSRFFRVRWAGWSEEDDSWINWRQLDALDAIDAFWDSSDLDRAQPVWLDTEVGLRCRQCCKLFSRAQDLKTHHTRKVGGCAWAEASRSGSKAEKAVVKAKKAAAHKAAGAVYMGEGALKAAFSFKYLGVWFSADGDKVGGREARMEQAADRYRQMGNIWNISELSEGLKLRPFQAAVVSVLVYGCECWDLSEKASTALRAWNARRMTMITGRDIREEYLTPSFDLLCCIRVRRLKWAGQLLRAKESFLPRRVALAELERYDGMGHPGEMFQDAPKHLEVDDLIVMARDKQAWGKWIGLCVKKNDRCCKANQGIARQANINQGLSDAFWIAGGHHWEDGEWKLNDIG